MTKMRTRMALSIFLVCMLVLVISGCKKINGGGWFINDGWPALDHKIMIAFTAQPTGEVAYHPNPMYPPGETAKGQFQLIDLDAKTIIHGEFLGAFTEDPAFPYEETQSIFWGECSINGEYGHFLEAHFIDNGEPGVQAGDRVEIWIDSFIGIPPNYLGTLMSGNIQIH
ncbi:MAG: hypothetical protein ACMUIU_11485 [bacterium]